MPSYNVSNSNFASFQTRVGGGRKIKIYNPTYGDLEIDSSKNGTDLTFYQTPNGPVKFPFNVSSQNDLQNCLNYMLKDNYWIDNSCSKLRDFLFDLGLDDHKIQLP